MRTFRNLCAAVVLTLTLASSAAAGTMHTGVAGPTPTPEPQAAATTEDQTGTVQADGTIYTGVAESESAASAVAEIAQTLLQSALALF